MNKNKDCRVGQLTNREGSRDKKKEGEKEREGKEEKGRGIKRKKREKEIHPE